MNQKEMEEGMIALRDEVKEIIGLLKDIAQNQKILSKAVLNMTQFNGGTNK